MSAFGLDVICMGENMNRLKKLFSKKYVFWLVLIVVFVSAVAAYAVLPVISLNSPTSFPVDI
jgi:hypothetical protein